jgi:5-methylcytosine-specific restriction protein A
MTPPPYYEHRAVPGCPWDAPREWFIAPVYWMAWRCRTPLKTAEGHGQARDRLKATRTMRENTYRHDGYQCVFCNATTGLTVDHIVPVAFGGSNHITNLRTLCGACNGRHFAEHHQSLFDRAALGPARAA